MRVLVLTGNQVELTMSVEASTTTGTFVAQEIVKQQIVVTGAILAMMSLSFTGFGSDHTAVERPAKLGPHPLVPGR